MAMLDDTVNHTEYTPERVKELSLRIGVDLEDWQIPTILYFLNTPKEDRRRIIRASLSRPRRRF